ncbi:MAG: PilZ domain-containing protein [Deltaproteobacteria bacterium]|nr:PilZ domain-containing protein [Deltaproteobacteria bacterium]
MTLNTTSARSQAGEHLRLLELCYRYAHLSGRRRAGIQLSSDEQGQLDSLAGLFEGDTGKRRRCRRFPLVLHALVKTPRGFCSAVVTDMSGAGMYLALCQDLAAGDTVQVRLGRPDEVDYLFTCDVVRVATDLTGETTGVGLSYCCVPLEMRRRAA